MLCSKQGVALRGYLNKVFIVYADADEEKAEKVYNYFVNHGLTCLDHKRTDDTKRNPFLGGRPVFDNIKQAVLTSETTLVLLTNDSFDRGWVTLETMIALEKSNSCGQMCVRLLSDVNEESKKTGLLNYIPQIDINFSNDDWMETDELLNQTAARVKNVQNLLPAGNVAHGQVYSHFIGYMRNVLPVEDFETKIKEHDLYKENPGKMSLKYYLLLPYSCHIPDSLEMNTGAARIENVGCLTYKCTLASKDRDYKPAIYRISTGQEEYFAVCELPNVLKIMSKIKDDVLGDIDTRLQLTRFHKTMEKALKYQENHFANVCLLPYDDQKQTAFDVLFEAVKTDVQHEAKNLEEQPVSIPSLNHSNLEAPIVSIHCCNDCTKDREIASNIEDYLSLKGVQVERHSHEGASFIFVMSREAMHEKVLVSHYKAAVALSAKTNQMQTLVVVDELSWKHIPDDISWMTYFRTDDVNYLESIYRSVTGKVELSQTKLPAGDVATGLAYSYVLSYMPIALADLSNRILNHMQECRYIGSCVKAFYSIVPRSCDCSQELHKFKGIEQMKKLSVVEYDIAGTHGRGFELYMFKFTRKNGEEIFFIGEYSTPVNTLYHMAHDYPEDAGLPVEEMRQQALAWATIVQDKTRDDKYKQAVNIPDLDKLFCVVIFDDSVPNSLQDELERQIEEDLQRDCIVSWTGETNPGKKDLETDNGSCSAQPVHSEPLKQVQTKKHMQSLPDKNSKLAKEETQSQDPGDPQACCVTADLPKEQETKAVIITKQDQKELYIKGCRHLLSEWLAGRIGTHAPTSEDEKKLILEACCPSSLKLKEYTEDMVGMVYKWLAGTLAVNHLQQVATHRAWIMWTYTFLDRVGVTFAGQMDKQALLHDLSKFSPEEILGYAIMFGPGQGFRKIDDKKELEQWVLSLNHHYDNNPHHPEYFYPKNEAGVREKRDLLDKDQGLLYLEESIIDMLACRAERELADDPEIKVEKWMYIADNFLKRYTDRDRMWVQEKVKEWLEKMKEFLSNQQNNSQTADLFKGKPVL